MLRCVAVGLLSWLVVIVPAAAQTAEQKQATVAYLHRLQGPNGGYAAALPAASASPQPSLSATLSALRALRYFGGASTNRDVDVNFVASCFDKSSGGFADRPGQTAAVLPTAIGAMAA